MKYEPKTSPYGHQTEALRRSWMRDGYGYLMEMGTGKSKVIVDEMSALWENGEIDTALVLAPKGVYGNWSSKEIPAHMPDRVRESAQVHLWTGGHTVRERAQFDKLCRPSSGLRLLVINTESVATSAKAAEAIRRFLDSGRCYAAVDEASTIKNPSAQRTKFLITKVGRHPNTHFRRIATGSPVPRGPLDLWAQFEFLAPACLGYRSYYPFRNTYGIVQRKEFGGRMVELVVGYRNVEELAERISRHSFIMRKQDCLDLPPKVFVTRDVELTDEQRRLYEEVRQWATAEISAGRFVTATAVITQLLRLHQIVCGYVVDENGEGHDVPTRRLDAMMEVVAEASDKTIVWCTYRTDVQKVVDRLRREGRRVVEYHGGTSVDDRTMAVWRFQGTGNPEHPLWQWGPDGIVPPEEQVDDFVGTPHAGGYGITLTAAGTVIYYSNTYDLEKRAQSEDRAHRIGQTRSVTYVDLVARNTVDEKIIQALANKQQLADIIMAGPDAVRELFT